MFHRNIFLLLIVSSLSVVQWTSLAGVLKMPRVKPLKWEINGFMLNVTDQYCISPATSKGGFSCHPGVLSRKCHLCHRSCKSRRRGTRPLSSRYKTVRNIFTSRVSPLFEISTRLLPDGSPLTLGAVLMSTVMFVHMIVLLIAGIHTRCGRLC